MKICTPLFALFTAVAIAGCESAPTAALSADESAPRATLNSAPVAVIHVVSKKPYPAAGGNPAYMSWSLDAQGSYDADGDPLSYSWTSDCVYIPNGYDYAWTANANLYETCYIDLYVSDGTSTTNARAKLYNSTITYL